MFDKKFWTTSFAMVTVVLFSALLVNAPDKGETVPLAETVYGIGQESESSGTGGQNEYAYLLKEYNGRIAVFAMGEDVPQMVLETLVKYLPDYDRSQLERGVPVRDYSELSALIEDYIS